MGHVRVILVLVIVRDSVGKRWNGCVGVHGVYLLCELNNQRQLVGLDKSQEVLFGQLSIKGIAPFIKL